MQLKIVSRKKFTALLCALGLISIVAIYPRQTVNFFYSTAIQINDYIHFYGYHPVKSFAIRIPANYTIHGIDVSRWQERIDWQRVAKMRDNGIRFSSGQIISANGGFCPRRFPCRAGRRRARKIIGKRITQTGQSVAKNGRKKHGKKADYLCWRDVLSHESGGPFQ